MILLVENELFETIITIYLLNKFKKHDYFYYYRQLISYSS